jgi:stage II sporulation protein GA (sporulation sigma-E factor processing peptidase)
MPVIYADVLIALNWLVDYLLLSATAYVLRIPTRRLRVVLGALLGGIYSCLLLLPTIPPLIRLGIDIIAAAVMILISYPKAKIGVFLKRTVVFFTVSTVFFGIVSLLSAFSSGEQFLVHNGSVYADISPLTLTVFTVGGYGVIRLYEYLTRKRMPKGGDFRLSLEDGRGEYVGRALYDTGLHLREPFSGAPVIVVERRAVMPFLSAEMVCALERAEPCPRIRMIPYRTVGGDGLLPAFRPHRVRVRRFGDEDTDITGVYVAVCDELGRGEYEALIGNDCWEGRREW